ncbi:tautomerase family protein [Novosphingobium mangrovi (ex Huang et al. 2023)]|uniref:Tautomerase family protein n=1 Tax=Novosphingobium mangrovi (ex Huang et al. 2023) TaxID=2976432 RepID=A0ABT2I9B6_9SPHN|nr:tautomerase family protein [Novosphingobium mangrovi (ex Huang et al. 2023)]MCT2401407.1 tautomerase family protein [Novosphingobium mangrovi (ex Huang et al. 2023)]
MPVAQLNLVRGAFGDDAIGEMLIEISHFYARTLYPDVDVAPIERVRVMVTLIEPQHWAAGGRLASEGGATAPYFSCLVLTGRTEEQHRRLIEGFTDIIARNLECDRLSVRGQVIPIAPENWGIGGIPASVVRKAEIAARAGL